MASSYAMEVPYIGVVRRDWCIFLLGLAAAFQKLSIGNVADGGGHLVGKVM